MPIVAIQNTSPNKILAHLSVDDFLLLKPHLKPVEMPLRMNLEACNKPITHVYFVDRGIVSVVANGSSKRGIEVGIIGSEGMTGLAVLMGADSSTNETYVQVAGEGQRLTSANLRRAIDKSPTLHRDLLRYGHAFVTQTAQTALANGRSKIEQRLARWLLMAHDRIEGDELAMTHEFLSVMLGVRRAGVTEALNLLQGEGLIRAKRGGIVILKRSALEKTADGAYGAPEAEFRRLFNR